MNNSRLKHNLLSIFILSITSSYIALSSELKEVDEEQLKLNQQLIEACNQRHDIETIKELVKKGADINYMTEKKETPLYLSCIANQTEAADFLCSKGANVNTAIGKEEIPLLYNVLLRNATSILSILQKYSIDLNLKWSGTTPLHYAANCSNYEILALLIQGGADVNAKNFWGKTPLDSALVAKLFIKSGNDKLKFSEDIAEPPSENSWKKELLPEDIARLETEDKYTRKWGERAGSLYRLNRVKALVEAGAYLWNVIEKPYKTDYEVKEYLLSKQTLVSLTILKLKEYIAQKRMTEEEVLKAIPSDLQ